jgi:hypothetical protein
MLCIHLETQLGGGPEPARFAIEIEHVPLSLSLSLTCIVRLLAAILLFEILPYEEEWRRGWRRAAALLRVMRLPPRGASNSYRG